jgi:tetratricopeptide (TPR) repeat protein
VFAPFRRVEATLEGEVVVSLVFRLENTAAIEAAAELFGLAKFMPAVIESPRGELLGQIYPERGALFGFVAHDESPRVAHVVLEAPATEGFLVRAQQNWRWRPQTGLTDIRTVLAFDPENLQARKLLGAVLLALARPAEALAAVEEALSGAPEDVHLRLLRSRALLDLGRGDEAEREALQVMDHPRVSSVDRAAAQLLLGDILAAAPRRDVRSALGRHYEAAERATAAVQEAMRGSAAASRTESDDDRGAYREGLWIAVEAYLAIARDLAEGHWRQRAERFGQWVRHAEATVEGLAPADSKEDWLFHVRCRALESSAASGGKIDPAPYAAAALEHGARLLATSSDPIHRANLQEELGAAFLETSESLHVAGKREAARNYIFDAQRLLEAAVRQEAASRETAYLLGRTYFVLGLDRAVAGDHRAAAEWYAKAVPLWEQPLPPARIAETGALGQRMVSMAVSFWEAERRDQALALTEKGLQWMQRATDRGALDRAALAVPLANLAKMNRLLGNEDQAERYQTRLVDFQTPATDDPKE